MYKRERKTGRLNLRVSESELKKINQICYEDDETIAQVIRKAIKAYINDREKRRE